MHTELPSDWSTLLQLLEGLRTKTYDEKVAEYVHTRFTKVNTTDLSIDLNQVRTQFLSEAREAATALLSDAARKWGLVTQAVEALNAAQDAVGSLYNWNQRLLDPSFAPLDTQRLVKALFQSRMQVVWTNNLTIESILRLSLDDLMRQCTNEVQTFVSSWESLMCTVGSFSCALCAARRAIPVAPAASSSVVD